MEAADSARSVEEFLLHEQKCSVPEDDDVDILNIFEQISRLQSGNGNSDLRPCDRNIEDILSEAETLVSKTSERDERHKKSSRWRTMPHKHSAYPRQATRVDDQQRSPRSRINLTDENCNPSSKVEKLNLKNVFIDKKSIRCTPIELNDNVASSHLHYNGNSPAAEPISSPKLRNNESINRKLNAALEELKDAKERLKSSQMQYETLAETSKQLKAQCDEQTIENRTLDLKLSDKDETLSKLCKDIDALKNEKSQLSLTETNLREEMARLKDDKKNLTAQINKDKVTILDLQRQCKEMENILMKRHPDSVSALIVASKHPPIESDTKTLLEKRIAQLENELKEQDDKYQKVLVSIQGKVNAMKENYETHISDLEKQVINLQLINSEMKDRNKVKEFKEFSLQTDRNTSTIAIQTMPMKPLSAKAKSQNAVSSTSGANNNNNNNNNAKEDTHLVATVRGLNAELAQKEKNILKLNKELEDCRKSIVRLQKSKDVAAKTSVEKVTQRKQATKVSNVKVMKLSTDNINLNSNANKENSVKQENEKMVLKNEFNNLQKDYENLKRKRIDDLVELQTAHEKELMNLNMKVMPLQQDVESLNSTVETLRNQIKSMDDQLSVIVTERDHFKSRAEQLNLKLGHSLDSESDRSIKSGRTSDRDYDSLKMKVMELEKRYECREVRLKTLINSLAKLKDVHTGMSSLDTAVYPDSSI